MRAEASKMNCDRLRRWRRACLRRRTAHADKVQGLTPVIDVFDMPTIKKLRGEGPIEEKSPTFRKLERGTLPML